MSTAAVPPIDSLTTLPQPSHITLLLRHHKSTVFLSVAPNQSLTSIKTLLLSALQARGITSLPSTSPSPSSLPAALDDDDTLTKTPLPSDPEAIELGVLVDRKDASRGWMLLDPSSSTTTSVSSKAKSKAKASAASAKASATDADTPAGAGLVDGSWLAYRVKKAGGSSDGLSVDEDGNVEIDMQEDQGWDVVLPSFEEEEPEQDAGGDEDEEMQMDDEIPAGGKKKKSGR